MSKEILLAAVLLGGCAAFTAAPPGSVYSAAGEEPFWELEIGNGRMLLTRASGTELSSTAFPLVPATTDGAIRRWEVAEGTRVITVEAQPGPCDGRGGARFEDRVTVSLSGVRLEGCGGWKIEGGAE